MDCKHFVKVLPIEIIDQDGFDMLVLEPYHYWLSENHIIRYRGGLWSTDEMNGYFSRPITFRFANKEDAMAFKLAWI